MHNISASITLASTLVPRVVLVSPFAALPTLYLSGGMPTRRVAVGRAPLRRIHLDAVAMRRAATGRVPVGRVSMLH